MGLESTKNAQLKSNFLQESANDPLGYFLILRPYHYSGFLNILNLDIISLERCFKSKKIEL